MTARLGHRNASISMAAIALSLCGLVLAGCHTRVDKSYEDSWGLNEHPTGQANVPNGGAIPHNNYGGTVDISVGTAHSPIRFTVALDHIDCHSNVESVSTCSGPTDHYTFAGVQTYTTGFIGTSGSTAINSNVTAPFHSYNGLPGANNLHQYNFGCSYQDGSYCNNSDPPGDPSLVMDYEVFATP